MAFAGSVGGLLIDTHRYTMFHLPQGRIALTNTAIPGKDQLETTCLQHQMAVISVHVFIVSKSRNYVLTTFSIACSDTTTSQSHSSI